MAINESNTVSYTVVTTRVTDGTVLYWTNSGTTVGSDFSDANNSGSFTITNNQGTFTRTLANDSTTEGSETVIIQIRTGSISGPIVATSNSLTINDTSLSPQYKLYVWGENSYGQLGLNNTDNLSTPTQLGTSTDWTYFAEGDDGRSRLAVRDGTLWSWGGNSYGQLGLNNTIDRSSPTQIGSLTNWAGPSGDESLTCTFGSFSACCLAVKSDGTLWAWGGQYAGALGLNTNSTYVSSPTQFGALTNWKKVYTAGQTTFAIKTDGTLWGWGWNANGNLGKTDTVDRSSPVQIGTATWSSVKGGHLFAIGVRTDGTLWSWGRNLYGQLGQGTTGGSSSSPTQIGAGTTWVKISTAYASCGATKTDKSLWTWGQNSKGQLGLNDSGDRNSPVQVSGTWNDFAMKKNIPGTQAIKSDGTLWSWGWQLSGGVGNGVNFNSNVESPVQIDANTNWGRVFGGTAITNT